MNLLRSKTIYIKGKKKKSTRKTKKTVTTVAIMLLGTIITVQKSRGPHQSTVTATVLIQCKHYECTVPKYCSGHWHILYIR